MQNNFAILYFLREIVATSTNSAVEVVDEPNVVLQTRNHVNTHPCDAIYVTTTGTLSEYVFSQAGGVGNGTIASPSSFLNALTLVTSTRNAILLAGGTYSLTAKVTLPSNVIIEGEV